jgi:cell division control protein 24
MNQDTIHYLFPNLNKLLNFQRKFLIRLESTAELPWQDQRWGLHFIENVSQIRPFILISTDFGTPVVVLYTPLFFLHSFPLSHSDLLQEEEFVVYEPYCANYTNAADLMLTHEQSLMVCHNFLTHGAVTKHT